MGGGEGVNNPSCETVKSHLVPNFAVDLHRVRLSVREHVPAAQGGHEPPQACPSHDEAPSAQMGPCPVSTERSVKLRNRETMARSGPLRPCSAELCL